MTKHIDPTSPHDRRVGLTLVIYGLLAVLSALMLYVALPGCEHWYLSFVALVPLLVVLQRAPARTGVLVAWLAGLFFFLLAVSWLNRLTPIGWVALAFYLSLSFAVFALTVIALTAGRLKVPFVLAVPLTWVVVEFLRGLPLGGFCWHYVGHNLYRQTMLIQVADFSGVYGVSFLAVTVNALLARVLQQGFCGTILKRRQLVRVGLATAYTAALLVGVAVYGGRRLAEARPTAGPRVSVVQGNIPQDIKEYAQSITWEQCLEKREYILDTYTTLTERLLLVKDDLVVWPETVVPVLEGEIWREHDYSAASRRRVRDLRRKLGRPFLVGSVKRVRDDRDLRDYNAAYLFPTDDGPFEVYLKINLVPFGEYIPFRSVGWIETMLRWFLPEGYLAELSAGTERVLFRADDVPFATPICYEDTTPSLIREFRRDGARFIVNLTNDGWFGDTVELDQHMANSVFRTVENRVGLVRAANTGISAFIDPRGVITSFLSDEKTGRYREVPGVLTGTVYLDDRRTFYTARGDVFIWTASGLVGVLVVVRLVSGPSPCTRGTRRSKGRT